VCCGVLCRSPAGISKSDTRQQRMQCLHVLEFQRRSLSQLMRRPQEEWPVLITELEAVNKAGSCVYLKLRAVALIARFHTSIPPRER